MCVYDVMWIFKEKRKFDDRDKYLGEMDLLIVIGAANEKTRKETTTNKE